MHVDDVPMPRTNLHYHDLAMKGERITEVGNKRIRGKGMMPLEEYDVAMSLSPVDDCHDAVVNIGLQRRVANHALHKGKMKVPGTARRYTNWSRLGIGG